MRLQPMLCLEDECFLAVWHAFARIQPHDETPADERSFGAHDRRAVAGPRVITDDPAVLVQEIADVRGGLRFGSDGGAHCCEHNSKFVGLRHRGPIRGSEPCRHLHPSDARAGEPAVCVQDPSDG